MISKECKIKLELVQLNGIVKLLLEKCEPELLELRVQNLLDSEIKDVKKTLGRMSRKQLISLVEQVAEIEEEDINRIYELNRYGLKPGFTLCYLSGKCKKLELVDLKENLVSLFKSIEYEEDEQYKKICCKSVEKITNDTFEVALSYLVKHPYISEEEKPEYIYEFKETFVWINSEEGYLAIRNAPNKVVLEIKKTFSKIYETPINTVCLTKKMIMEIFGENTMRKGTYYKPNASNDEAQKVTIADANLSDKPNVRAAYGAYDLTSSSMEETVNEGVSSTLGINCKKGKIYLYKNLNASDFRAWSVRRIKDIISYMRGANLEDYEAFRVKNIMDDSLWNGYNAQQKQIIEKIMFSLYCAKKHDLEAYNIECTIAEILEKCDKLFVANTLYECEECGEICVPNCPNCGSTKLMITKNRKMICLSCGEQQEGTYKLQCEDGHVSTFLGIERIISLIPLNDLYLKMIEGLKRTFGLDFSEADSFYLFEGALVIMSKKSEGGKINVSEIPEFQCLYEEKLSLEERDLKLKEYDKIKEKCRYHKNEACNRCEYTTRKCIMNLFIPFGFRPSPHQNSEFGDVNFQVTYHNSSQRLVGIAKSKTSATAETLTTSTKEAREMIQQVLTMSHDTRADIIATVCPMRFHPQLEMELEYIARLSGKKLICFDDEFMVRLLAYNDKLEALKREGKNEQYL